MRNRLMALLATVLMAVVWVSPMSVAYLCSMDGGRRATCCCAPDQEHAEPRHSEVERRDCCEVERTPGNMPSAVTPAGDDEHRQVATISWLVAQADGSFSAATFVPRLPRGPPQAIGPPPYLRNCRFLI
jgi:hypothetical protein